MAGSGNIRPAAGLTFNFAIGLLHSEYKQLVLQGTNLSGNSLPFAPKFTGRFNKGVDYVGDLVQFEREFNDDLCVIAHAVKQYGLPANLKLSVHSGSDKFSLYPAIRRALAKHGAGVHVKTAGTTWLEEVIGLAEADACRLLAARAALQAIGQLLSRTAMKLTPTHIESARRHLRAADPVMKAIIDAELAK